MLPRGASRSLATAAAGVAAAKALVVTRLTGGAPTDARGPWGRRVARPRGAARSLATVAAGVAAAKALFVTRISGGVPITPRWVKSATASYLFPPPTAASAR